MSVDYDMPQSSVSLPEIGRRCEFKTYHTTPKKGGQLVTETVLEPFGRLHLRDGDSSYALVIQRRFTDKHELDSTTLRINSPHLLGVFREVVGSTYTTVASDFRSPFEMTSPFQMLMHYWDELEQYRDETEDNHVRQHLKLLFDFMDHELGPDRKSVTGMVLNGRINYTHSWVLFRPGGLVYASVMGHPWLLQCQKTAYEESTIKGPYIVVTCTYTDHDGALEGAAVHKFTIFQKEHFGAENPAFITDLPVYPRRFAGEAGTLEARLEERGRNFLARRTVCVQAYNGIAQYLKEPPELFYNPEMAEFDGVWLPFTESGRIILDRKTFHEDQYSNQVSIKAMTPDPLLCPPYEYGYSLSRKDWCRFLVDNMRDVEWKEGVWESLVLPTEHKLVLQALVTSHQYPDDARDQPELKGKGLIFLLHGSPGSGKTLTAETAAEGTRKALVSSSLGDLNRYDSPRAFEIRLKEVLSYATIWRAVVLLDEADVFLEARHSLGDSTTRNALVAVFLRELEYFSGIIFLTTNRLTTFDAAMKSRIHLALEYSLPNVETRRQIWMNLLSSMPTEGIDIEDIDDAVVNLLVEKLNGREISNTFSTARTIARSQNKRLNLEHIERVIRVRNDFERSLQTQAQSMSSTATGLSSSVAEGFRRQDSIIAFEST